MKDFLLIFRSVDDQSTTPTPEQMEATMKKWMDWLGGLGQSGKLADQGNALHATGKVVKPGHVITNGPYTEIKESVGGYSVVKAASYDEAVELSKGCPIFDAGGSVEVREIAVM